MSRLKQYYEQTTMPELMKQFNYKSIMQVPKIEKIVVNMGVGDAVANPKAIDDAVEELMLLSGQRPITIKAKRSVANFKLRAGMPIGCKVTLRGERMYYFLDKLVSIGLPRVRDFRGVSRESFDGRGNYTLGVREQIIFPEVSIDKVKRVRGMDIVIVTTAQTDDEGRALLQSLGMPFRR
ncbi:MAG: 50S ribosomal protein L5 [Acholeplasmataceae bacterium]|jgi:large subunit ribosomal protein L5|nr:50S ribosomal protein L5 [Acholeplasmataceae bacterium]